ncbi:MAG: hypothetical protein AAF846_12215 [Chloroflexota bacterium]
MSSTKLSKISQCNHTTKEDREAFMEKFNTGLSHQYGAVMRKYVHVPDELLSDIETLKPYLEKSFDYVQTLKPKPTKK